MEENAPAVLALHDAYARAIAASTQAEDAFYAAQQRTTSRKVERDGLRFTMECHQYQEREAGRAYMDALAAREVERG